MYVTFKNGMGCWGTSDIYDCQGAGNSYLPEVAEVPAAVVADGANNTNISKPSPLPHTTSDAEQNERRVNQLLRLKVIEFLRPASQN